MTEMNRQTSTCTAEEAEVLSMVKCWPGIPAVVTYSPEEGWSVGTRIEDIDMHKRTLATLSPNISVAGPPRD